MAQKLFINSYGGMGDAVRVARVALAIQPSFAGEVHVIESHVWGFLTSTIPAVAEIRLVPLPMRKALLSPYRAKLLAKEHGFNLVLNLRFDAVRHPLRHRLAARVLEAHAIRLEDLCTGHEPRAHIDSLMFAAAQRLMPDLAPPPDGWLRAALRLPRSGPERDVIIAAHSQQRIKEINPKLLRTVLDALSLKRLKICLIAGEEVRIAPLRQRYGTAVEFLVAPSMRTLAERLCACRLAITTDSFVGCLADALGVTRLALHFSTEAKVYGATKGGSLEGDFRQSCPRTNLWGNCDGWDSGCFAPRCTHLRVKPTLRRIVELLQSDDVTTS